MTTSVLMVAANPTTNQWGWPVGFWLGEVAHPYLAFEAAGYEIVLASPDGGDLEPDGWSVPGHESGYSDHDVRARGFMASPGHAGVLRDTPKLGGVDLDDVDAVLLCGGQSPMFTFRDNADVHHVVRAFHDSGRVTAAMCHGVAGLLDVTSPDGGWLVEGRTITGFANVEEDAAAETNEGQRFFEWTIEDAADERGANYVRGPLFAPYAVRDGNLITGQQQNSGGRVAELVIEALGR